MVAGSTVQSRTSVNKPLFANIDSGVEEGCLLWRIARCLRRVEALAYSLNTLDALNGIFLIIFSEHSQQTPAFSTAHVEIIPQAKG